MTVCMVIANRLIKEANTSYKNSIDGLIEKGNLDPKMIEAGLNLALETTYLFDKEGLKESY